MHSTLQIEALGLHSLLKAMSSIISGQSLHLPSMDVRCSNAVQDFKRQRQAPEIPQPRRNHWESRFNNRFGGLLVVKPLFSTFLPFKWFSLRTDLYRLFVDDWESLTVKRHFLLFIWMFLGGCMERIKVCYTSLGVLSLRLLFAFGMTLKMRENENENEWFLIPSDRIFPIPFSRSSSYDHVYYF